jgi:hypothetical protein
MYSLLYSTLLKEELSVIWGPNGGKYKEYRLGCNTM